MDLGALLGKAAPWLAAAAAGPAGLAGMAVKTVAEALGAADTTVQAITTAVAGASPEQIAALRAADQAFEARMRELGIREVAELEQIAAADRASAREMQTQSRSVMPAVLTCGTGLAFSITLAALFLLPIPEGNRDVIVYMCGQLAAAFAACLAFWVGTTRSSQTKTDLLARAEPVR